MDIVLLIILLIAALYIYRAVRLVIKRTIAYKKIRALRNNPKIKLKFTRKFFPAVLKMSHAPDVVAEVGDEIYLMRFYNGQRRRRIVHFANAEYSAIFSIVRHSSLYSLGSLLKRSGEQQSTTQSTRIKVRIVPKLQIPNEYKNAENEGKKIVPVLIFNPAPSDVSYVTDENNSIKLAFTGDSFRGIKIFTATTVAVYLDRVARHLGDKDYDRSQIMNDYQY